ncbi:MAG: 4-alpha-glucanotransferase [Myxococcota bacterium]|jgi:4-alpha-glucanotransferase
MSQLTRSAGVLLHPTSLPSPHGIGDLGAGARRFVDWLEKAGVGLWQILPLVPVGAGDSPYATASALAGNPLLIDLRGLAEVGLLTAAELTEADASCASLSVDAVDFDRVRALKQPILDVAADRLAAGTGSLASAFAHFAEAELWARETATFLAIKAANAERPWWEWDARLREYDPDAVAEAQAAHGEAIARRIAIEFLFEHQWDALRAYAADKGVRILGDVPIYVDRDSADVWSNQDEFRLGSDGTPTVVAGVPPDFFCENGQRWGNPLYDWEAMAKSGHAWWIRRLRRAMATADLVRIDHFRGFSAFWEIPADAPDARTGRWVDGPGKPLFDDLASALGALPIIAEDLGVMDEAVVALRDAVGLPGMRILQFAFGESADHPFLPHNHVEHCVAYTATHDNDTSLGWWGGASDAVRDHVRRYLAVGGQDIVWDLIRACLASVARLAVVPFQDVLCLDSGSRMNTPGVGTGNWTWRVREAAFNGPLAGRLASLNQLYGRHATERLRSEA